VSKSIQLEVRLHESSHTMNKTPLRMLISASLALTLVGCSVLGPSDETQALELARKACDIEKRASDSGEIDENGDWTYIEVSHETSWNGRDISMVDLTSKLEKLGENAEEATSATLLDSKWQILSDDLNTMYAFVSRIYSMRKQNNYSDEGLDGERDFNIPLYSTDTTCKSVQALLLENE
jgi:hypothetical protein